MWILLEQETVSDSGISWAICKSAPRSRQITMPVPHHSCFLQAGCPSCRPTNSVKALKLVTSLTIFKNHGSLKAGTQQHHQNLKRHFVDLRLTHFLRVQVNILYKRYDKTLKSVGCYAQIQLCKTFLPKILFVIIMKYMT